MSKKTEPSPEAKAAAEEMLSVPMTMAKFNEALITYGQLLGNVSNQIEMLVKIVTAAVTKERNAPVPKEPKPDAPKAPSGAKRAKPVRASESEKAKARSNAAFAAAATRKRRALAASSSR